MPFTFANGNEALPSFAGMVGERDLRGRRLLIGLLLVPIAIAVVAAGTDAAAQVVEPPNIVVVMTDDQTAESMKVMDRTRALLGGDQGASFTNSYVNLPLCCPSRATFLTGLYAHNHHVTTNEFPEGGFYKFDPDYGDRNLATALEGAGYHTALVGKFMNQYGELEADPAQVPNGWSEWYATLEPNPDAYNYELNENGATVSYGSAAADHKTDVLTDKALEVIAAQTAAPDPFFLWLSYTAPHGGGPDPSPRPPADCDPGPQPAPRHATAFDTEPLPRPPNFNEADVTDKPPSIRNSPLLGAAEIQTLRGRYRCTLESLLSVDEGVTEVVGALSASGELDNTLVVFTSDNGFFFGEHRDDQGKGKHYEPSTRVPLLIRGPGVPAGAVEDELVVNADLTPTILDAAGVAPPVAPDGLSLLSLFADAEWQRQDLLLENRTYAAVRDERYVYVEHTGGEDGGEIELYDLAVDPYELDNRHGAPDYAGVEAQLAGRLVELRDCAGETCSSPPDGPGPGPGPGPPPPGPDVDPPETTLTKVPAKRASKRKVKFKFSADEPGSTFECRLDKRAFRPCDSAGTEKLGVRRGRHRFRVRATDLAGNVDPSPDRRKFKVVARARA